MIAVDTNVLVYAHRADSPRHAVARQVLFDLATGTAPWALPWPCVHEFLAVVTRRELFETPSTTEQAFDQIAAWQEAPGCRIIGESPRHALTLRELAIESGASWRSFHDVRIAAICVDHGVTEILTNDRGFGHFTGLGVRDPFLDDEAL